MYLFKVECMLMKGNELIIFLYEMMCTNYDKALQVATAKIKWNTKITSEVN